MAVDYYDKAEVYLTTCTHPEFDYLRYVGLDTKCDPNYLGSSVTLKWFINKIGRMYFKKKILEICSGTMREICRVEQHHIVKHDAVKNPNYLNMNGGIKYTAPEHDAINLDYSIQPTEPLSQDFVNNIVSKLCESIKFFNMGKRQLARRVISMATYGYLKYGQESFDYNRFQYYGSCNEEVLQKILASLANLGILDSSFSTIKITQHFIDELPEGITYSDFAVKNN